MKNERIFPKMLCAQVITRVPDSLAKELRLREDQKSICVFTATMDDFVYIGGDDATKKADVELVYAKSMFGGISCASTLLQGEGVGILAGPDVSQVLAALDTLQEFERNQTIYGTICNDEGNMAYFTYCISSVGTYFSKLLNIPIGSSLAYLGAPPAESIYAVDAALKASNAELVAFSGPPTETNWGGAMMVGSQSDCVAAASAWERAVREVAEKHICIS